MARELAGAGPMFLIDRVDRDRILMAVEATDAPVISPCFSGSLRVSA